MNTDLLNEARATRKNLKASRLYSGASIRDAVVMAADTLRQLAHERREDRGHVDAAYNAAFTRRAA
jgi:hypothetical protein